MRGWIACLLSVVILSGCNVSRADPVSDPAAETTVETTAAISAGTETSAMETALPVPEESAADSLQVYIMPTAAGGLPAYIIPDQEFQARLLALLGDSQNRQFLDGGIWPGTDELGFGFSYDGYRYEICNQDIIVARPEAFEGEHYYVENQELSDTVKDYVRLETGITAFLPEHIGDVISAELIYKDRESGAVLASERIDDREQAAAIAGWMKRAVIVNGGTACGFTDCELKLEEADGRIVTLAMASDSCNMYFVNGRYFQYRDVPDNASFFKLFEVNPIIRAWRNGDLGPADGGVVMVAEDGGVTPKSATFSLYNGTGLEIQYGEGYYLEQMVDRDWERCSYITDNWAFHDVAYSLETGRPAEIRIDWAWLYGTLDRGEYRLVKEIHEFRRTGDYDTYELTAEFVIP